jgi:hypothetical protein
MWTLFNRGINCSLSLFEQGFLEDKTSANGLSPEQLQLDDSNLELACLMASDHCIKRRTGARCRPHGRGSARHNAVL